MFRAGYRYHVGDGISCVLLPRTVIKNDFTATSGRPLEWRDLLLSVKYKFPLCTCTLAAWGWINWEDFACVSYYFLTSRKYSLLSDLRDREFPQFWVKFGENLSSRHVKWIFHKTDQEYSEHKVKQVCIVVDTYKAIVGGILNQLVRIPWHNINRKEMDCVKNGTSRTACAKFGHSLLLNWGRAVIILTCT